MFWKKSVILGLFSNLWINEWKKKMVPVGFILFDYFEGRVNLGMRVNPRRGSLLWSLFHCSFGSYWFLASSYHLTSYRPIKWRKKPNPVWDQKGKLLKCLSSLLFCIMLWPLKMKVLNQWFPNCFPQSPIFFLPNQSEAPPNPQFFATLSPKDTTFSSLSK